ncbi:MAG: hypothetical protein QM750_12460 [Rubrivivax sp.]
MNRQLLVRVAAPIAAVCMLTISTTATAATAQAWPALWEWYWTNIIVPGLGTW